MMYQQCPLFCLLFFSLNQLPIPQFPFGLQAGHERQALMSIATNKDISVTRVQELQVGHVAALNHIAPAWGIALNQHPGVLIKRWALALFPLDNQPSGNYRKVLEKFQRLGCKFIAQGTDLFRSGHPELTNNFSRWRKAAQKKSKKNARKLR